MSKVAKRMAVRQFFLSLHERELLRAGLMALRCGADSSYYPAKGRDRCVSLQIDALHSILCEQPPKTTPEAGLPKSKG
jgi:hypothetical protein